MCVWVSHRLDGGVGTLLTETQRAESWTAMLRADTVHSRWPTSMMPKNRANKIGSTRAVSTAAAPLRSRFSAASRRAIPEEQATSLHGMAGAFTSHARFTRLE